MKRALRVALAASTVLVSTIIPIQPLFAQAVAELYFPQISGPKQLAAGLSGTFEITIRNDGTITAPIELQIIFAGVLDQTDRIVAGGGLGCEVLHEAGTNAIVRCTGGTIGPLGEEVTVVVQGRGQSPGTGKLVAVINASRAVNEFGGGAYDNNIKQFDVTIN